MRGLKLNLVNYYSYTSSSAVLELALSSEAPFLKQAIANFIIKLHRQKNAMIIVRIYSRTICTRGYGYPDWNCSGIPRPLRAKERDTNSSTKLPFPLQQFPVRHSSNHSML
jgi:hypothetical protein